MSAPDWMTTLSRNDANDGWTFTLPSGALVEVADDGEERVVTGRLEVETCCGIRPGVALMSVRVG